MMKEENEVDKVKSMYLENLEEWVIEERKVVTYKYLSRSLKEHVNVAKQMLFQFVETKKKAGSPLHGVLYLVSGLVLEKNGEKTLQKVVLVKEKDLENTLKRFKIVTSQHIYSIQVDERVDMSALYATDLAVLKEEPMTSTSLNAIHMKGNVPREPNCKPIPIVEDMKKMDIKKESVVSKKKTGIEAAFAKSSKKQSPVKEEPKPKVEEKPRISGQKPSKKPGGNIANMFAKQALKPKVEKMENKAEEKENLVNQRIEEINSKETERSPELIQKLSADIKVDRPAKSGNKKSKDSSKNSNKEDESKKRKRIQVMSDSEEEEEEETCAEASAVAEEEAPPVSKLIESSDEEIPATPQPESRTAKRGRRRVRKMVDKTFMDAEGFMVTKKEMASASETDEEAEEVQKNPPVVEKEEVIAPLPKKPKLTNSGGKGQAGIMNFFKKK